MLTMHESVAVWQQEGQRAQHVLDVVAVEEPLEIRVTQGNTSRPVSITMRTPGHDDALALGFLFTEGVIQNRLEVLHIAQAANTIDITVAASVVLDSQKLERNFYTTSSCGVCGKSSIDAIRVKHLPISSTYSVASNIITQLPALARNTQPLFTETGGSHASSLFTYAGNHVLTREDVGRHNALDKVIGHCFQHEVNIRQCVLLVSGRASFELWW
jgi:FdhD protein